MCIRDSKEDTPNQPTDKIKPNYLGKPKKEEMKKRRYRMGGLRGIPIDKPINNNDKPQTKF